jgi:hypothetical protein
MRRLLTRLLYALVLPVEVINNYHYNTAIRKSKYRLLCALEKAKQRKGDNYGRLRRGRASDQAPYVTLTPFEERRMYWDVRQLPFFL